MQEIALACVPSHAMVGFTTTAPTSGFPICKLENDDQCHSRDGGAALDLMEAVGYGGNVFVHHVGRRFGDRFPCVDHGVAVVVTHDLVDPIEMGSVSVDGQVDGEPEDDQEAAGKAYRQAR